MRRAYKFRAYPTGPQEARATRLLADHCDLCTRPRQDTVICPVHGPMDADVNGRATSMPGPGWALVRPRKRPEKLSASADRAVT